MKINIKDIEFNQSRNQIIIKGERLDINNLDIKYSESRFFSYLELIIGNRIYLIKGLKSIWEHLNISTYDSFEKREDNNIYDLYMYISYLKSS